jgi:23S rRNA (guanosine2251-2'-O)-methyltransferase
MIKLGAKDLRDSKPTRDDLKGIKRRGIYIICDNILDAFNIGSIFRLADAVGVSKIYLCGKTQTPPYHRIAKAAVGTDKWISWEHVDSAVEAINRVKRQGSRVKVFAIEQGKGSVDFRKVKFVEPLAFVIGHETTGVSRDAISTADQLVEIPMFGVNRSLNVLVSLAMIMSKVIEDFNF